jgi:ABC-2 type transport system permease protein
MVNAFRYGFLGTADIPIAIAYGIIGLVIVLLTAIALLLLARGTGIRT